MDKSVTRTCVVCGVCIDGHHPNARVCSDACRVERKREREYRRYADNPEKHNEYRRNRYAANPEKRRESQRRYRAANLEKYREYERRYRAANPEKYRDRDRRRNAEMSAALQVLRDMNLI